MRAKTLVALALFASSGAALAQATANGLPLLVGQGAGGTSYSVPIQTLLFFTALSFIPALLLLMTGFTRIVIVLSLLRQALGTQSAPPNQVSSTAATWSAQGSRTGAPELTTTTVRGLAAATLRTSSSCRPGSASEVRSKPSLSTSAVEML